MKIVIISDLHVGSIFAPFPPDFKTKEGNRVGLNKGQMKLFKDFLKFKKEIKEFNPDIILLLGDLVQGYNPKEFGQLVMPCDLVDQAEAVVYLLQDICEKKMIFGVPGTLYHKGVEFHPEKVIVEKLGGKYFSYGVKTLLIEKFYVNIGHGATGSNLYKLFVLERESMFVKLSEHMKKISPIDIIIRGHLHWAGFFYLPNLKIFYLQNPCWQAWFPIKKSLRYFGLYQPDIGGIFLEIPSQKDFNKIRVAFKLYENPKMELFV